MGITHFWSATLNWFRSHASSETKTCRHQERRTAKPLTRLDCGGYPMSMPAIEATAVLHKRPQKTNPAPPRTPLTHRVWAGCEVREVRAGGPRHLMPLRASARRPIYLYWLRVPTFAPMFSPPVFAPRKRRHQVRRLTPRSAHGCRSVSEPARRTTPDTTPALRPPISPPLRARAACFQSHAY